MNLTIAHPAGATLGQSPENVYLALDAAGRSFGTGYAVYQFLPHLYPDCPVNIYLSLEAQPAARYALFGALVARARQLRDTAPDVPARMYTCLPADSPEKKFYEAGDFVVVGEEKSYSLKNPGWDGRLPMGVQLRQTPLNTLPEQMAFLERLRANNVSHIDLSYLAELLRAQHFTAIGAVNAGRLVGECLAAGAGTGCELYAIYVDSSVRRNGFASLMARAVMTLMEREGVRSFTTRVMTHSVPQLGLIRTLHGEEKETLSIYPALSL